MEPIGFAVGIIGLWSTCRDGYRLVASACSATTELAKIATLITIEGAKVSSWGQLWGLHGKHNASSTALQDFLDLDPGRESGTYLVLSSLSRKFADARSLEDEFGIQLRSRAANISKEDMQRKLAAFATRRDGDEVAVFDSMALQEWQKRMGFFQRCKWAATSKSKAEKLLISLREHANNLLRLCPTLHRERVQQGIVNIVLVSDQVRLEAIMKAANAGAQYEKDGRQKTMYKDLTAAANLKQIIEDGKHETQLIHKPQRLWVEDYSHLHLRGLWMEDSEMAWNSSTGSIDYVEWNSYYIPVGAKGSITEDEMKALILGLGRLLCAEPRPRNLQMLRCKGLFHDAKRSRYGIVYELPRPLRCVDKHIDEDQLKRRLPKDFNHLLKNPIMSLGYRFWLAKALVESVIAMHASGWLHKNIQPSSVLFFPVGSNEGEDSKAKRELDWNRMYLMGCQYSRPSDTTPFIPKANYMTSRANSSISETYQHPDKLQDPKRQFRHAYDVYSLGIVLLEIGLWESLDNSYISSDPGKRIRSLVKLSQRLVGACGNIYARCVRQCLQIETDDLSGDKSLETLSWVVAKDLALCRA